MTSREEKVKGFVHGLDVLIWSTEEVERLETSWRILGTLFGAHPEQPHQNATLSLPLLLLPQEVVLLLELGVLELCENTAAKACPWSKSSAVAEEPSSPFSVKSSGLPGAGGEATKSHSCVHLVQNSSSFRSAPGLLDEWRPPASTTGLQQLKCRVFRDLWSRGYYLTSGLKFGGDFLVYEAHPRFTHATFIAVVLPWQQSLDSRVGSLCRVAAQVRKKVLLCSERDQTTVVYFTLDWTKLQ